MRQVAKFRAKQFMKNTFKQLSLNFYIEVAFGESTCMIHKLRIVVNLRLHRSYGSPRVEFGKFVPKKRLLLTGTVCICRILEFQRVEFEKLKSTFPC